MNAKPNRNVFVVGENIESVVPDVSHLVLAAAERLLKTFLLLVLERFRKLLQHRFVPCVDFGDRISFRIVLVGDQLKRELMGRVSEIERLRR